MEVTQPGATIVALTVALLVGFAVTSGCDPEQAGRDAGDSARQEKKNFDEKNDRVFGRLNKELNFPERKGWTNNSIADPTLSTPNVRTRLAQEAGLKSASRVKDEDLRRSRLELPDGRQIGDVVVWQRPETTRAVVVARIAVPASVAKAGSKVTLRLHANDDSGNGNNCQADPDASRSTWFASVDGTDGPNNGLIRTVTLDKRRSATTSFQVNLTEEDVMGKAIVLTPGDSSTRGGCGVIDQY